MSLSMMGLGFSFGAKDKGLGKVIDKTTKGISAITGMVKTVGKQAGKFSMRSMFDLPSQAVSTMQNIASDTRVTTTMLEAYGVQANKVTRMATVGLNMNATASRKARKEMTGVAFSLNEDVGSISASWKSLHQAQVDVTKVGFKNFKEYQKFISVTNTDSKEFAASMGHMIHTLGMTDGEIKNLIETTVALGEKFDMGAEAVPGMIKNLKTMREVGASLFDAWGKDKTTKFLHSSTLVSGALMKSGLSADQAQASSNAFLTTIMKGKESFHALYTGVKQELGPLSQVLSENFLGPQQAFELLEKSPHEFVLQMHKATTQIGKLAEKQVLSEMKVSDAAQLSGEQRKVFDKKVQAARLEDTQRFTQQMSGLVGADITTLFMKNTDATMKQMGKLGESFDAVGGKKGIIKRYAKNHSDARTASERFAIAQDRLVTRMKKLKGTMSDTSFLVNYRESSKLMLGEMSKAAEKGGPVGKAMTMLVDFSNFGLGGVLSQLHPMGPALTTVIQRFAPFIQMLPALAVGMKALFSPFTILATLIGGIYLALKYPEEAKKAFDGFRKIVEKNLPKILSTVKTMAFAIAGAIAQVMVYIWERIDWGKVKSMLLWAAGKIGEVLVWALGEVVNIADWLITAFGNINFEVIRKNLAIGFKYAFYAVVIGVAWALSKIPDLFRGTIKIVYGLIAGFFDGIRDAFKEQFPILSGFFDVFFAAIKYGFTAVVGFMVFKWAIATAAAAAHYVATAAKAAWSYIAQTAAAATWAAAVLLEIAVLTLAGSALFIGMAAAAAVWAVAAIAEFVLVGAAAVASFASTAIAAAVAWVAIMGPITLVVAAIAGVALAVYAIVTSFKDAVGLIKGIGKKIVGVFKKIGKGIKDALLAPIKAAKAAWGKLKGAASSIWGGIKSVFSSGTKGTGITLMEASKMWQAEAGKSAKALMGTVKGAASVVSSKIEGMFDSASKSASSIVPVVSGAADAASKATVRANAATAKIVDDFVTATEHHVERAENLKFGFMKGEELSGIQKYASQIEGAILAGEKMDDAAYSSSERKAFKERAKDLLGQTKEQEEAFKKRHGMSQKAALGSVRQTRLIFATDSSMFSNMTVEQRKGWEERANNQRDFYARGRLDLEKKILSDSKNEDVYRAEQKTLELQAYDTKIMLWQKIGVANDGLVEKIISGQKITTHEALYAADVMATHWKTSSDTIRNEWKDKGPVSEAINKAMDTLDASHAKAMLNIKRSAFTTAADRIAAVSKVTKAHEGQRKKIEGFIAANKDDLMESSEFIQAALIGELKATTTKADAILEKSGKSAVANLKKVISEDFKITGTEAAGFLRDLAGIRPKKFREDLRKLRVSFEGFLTKLETKATKLIAKTNTKIAKHRVKYNDYWKHIEKTTKDYSDKILTVALNFWDRIIRMADSGTATMVVAAALMISTLKTTFKDVNLLDILTSGGKIYDWALRIVKSLQQAFAGKNPFDTAIELAARNASSIIDSMAAERSGVATLKPLTKVSEREISSSSARSAAKNDLINATHNPAWGEKVKSQLDTTNRILESGFRAMLMSQGTPKQRRRAKESFASINYTEDMNE